MKKKKKRSCRPRWVSAKTIPHTPRSRERRDQAGIRRRPGLKNMSLRIKEHPNRDVLDLNIKRENAGSNEISGVKERGGSDCGLIGENWRSQRS